MNLNFGARPWIYFSVGPFIGLFCFIFFLIVFYGPPDSSYHSNLSELLAGYFAFVVMAYVVGALPAFITGLIINVMSRKLHIYFRCTTFKFLIATLVGFIVTISLLIIFCYYTNELDQLYKTDPDSVLAISIYGAIAAVICESLYSKMGSHDKTP